MTPQPAQYWVEPKRNSTDRQRGATMSGRQFALLLATLLAIFFLSPPYLPRPTATIVHSNGHSWHLRQDTPISPRVHSGLRKELGKSLSLAKLAVVEMTTDRIRSSPLALEIRYTLPKAVVIRTTWPWGLRYIVMAPTILVPLSGMEEGMIIVIPSNPLSKPFALGPIDTGRLREILGSPLRSSLQDQTPGPCESQ